MTHGWMTALLLVTMLEEAAPPVRGRFCVAERKTLLTEGQCANASGTTLTVAPSNEERLFVWSNDTTAQIGVVPAKATSIDLKAGEHAAMELTIVSPEDVTIGVSAGKEQWRWSVDARSAARLRRIVAPRGRYALQLQAPHHRTLRKGPLAANEDAVAVGELRLVPLPVARGTVITNDEKPVSEAVVSLPEGTVCATANEQGAFACELPERLPEALIVSKSGYGPRELPLPRTLDADLDLGRISLGNARPLVVKVIRPDDDAATLTLYHDAPQRYQHSKLKSVPLREREEEVRFEVSEGKYLLLVEGNDPLERLEVPVTVKEGEEAREEISIKPYTLQGTVRLGEDILKEGRVEIASREHTWRAPVTVREGVFGGTMWQHGTVNAIAGGGDRSGPGDLVTSPELGADPSRWDIRIEKRMIAGRLLDAETRKPVVAEIGVSAEFAQGGKLYFTARPKDDGSYEINAARPGVYSLRVASPDHAPYKNDVRVAAEEKVKAVDILLERGVVQRLELVTPSGAPVANATVLEGVQPDRVNPQFITRGDTAGRYVVRGRAGETRLLYIVPQDGSFAVARVQLPRSSEEPKPQQIVVPPPSSSLRVRTIDADGKPVRATILIRYNGEFVPSAILRFVTQDWIGTPQSGEVVLPRLPAGAYELWAFTGRDEEEKLVASGGSLRAPVRAGLSGGEQTVTLTVPAR